MTAGTRQLLLAGGRFGPTLAAAQVLRAIARGLQAGGLPAPAQFPLDEHEGAGARELLDALDFDARMRASHAVVVVAARLSERTLAASIAFEIATRARQSGVPAYAITARNELSAFDARILDLQAILEAGSARALSAAGRRLAALL